MTHTSAIETADWFIKKKKKKTLKKVDLLLQLAQKYDVQKEEELRFWIEDVTGLPFGPDFQKGLKDGVILCE